MNHPDGFGGHPEGTRKALQGEGDKLQVLDGMELHVYPAEFCGGGEFKQECSPYPEISGMASSWASQ